eukprot:c50688_g1_i1 orf=112-357(-)
MSCQLKKARNHPTSGLVITNNIPSWAHITQVSMLEFFDGNKIFKKRTAITINILNHHQQLHAGNTSINYQLQSVFRYILLN